MKVCILALSTPYEAGMFHYSIELVKNLSRYCKVLVVTPLECVGFYSKLQNVDLFILNNSSRISLFFYMLKLRIMIKKFKNLVIHDPIGSGKIIRPLIVKLILYKSAPILTNLHDVELHSGMSILLSIFYRIFNKINVLLSDYIIVHDRISSEKVEKLYNFSTEKIFVIPHMAYSNFGENDSLILSNKPRVLFFGELRYNKGVDRLINIAQFVRKEINNICFTIAGSSKVIKQHSRTEAKIVKNSIEEMKKLDYFEVIDRYIPHQEVKDLFIKSSIVVLPYRDATQSGIVGMAYAFARPVVATNVGGLPEIIIHGETGFLAKSNKDQEIAELIIKILKDKELYVKMCKNAYKLYKTHLSPDTISKQIFNLYNKILLK